MKAFFITCVKRAMYTMCIAVCTVYTVYLKSHPSRGFTFQAQTFLTGVGNCRGPVLGLARR